MSTEAVNTHLPIRDGRSINILFVLLFSLKLIFRQNQLMHIWGIPGLADHLLMKHIFIFTDMWWMINSKLHVNLPKKSEQISAEKWCNSCAHPGWVSNKENSLFSSDSKVGYITVQTARDNIRPHVAFLLTVATTKQKLKLHLHSLIPLSLTLVKCQNSVFYTAPSLCRIHIPCCKLFFLSIACLPWGVSNVLDLVIKVIYLTFDLLSMTTKFLSVYLWVLVNICAKF